MSKEKETVFEPLDEIDWRDEEEFEREDQQTILLMKAVFGFGPFSVRGTKDVPRDEVFATRHRQLLEIANGQNEIIRMEDEDKPTHFSGLWFKKISGRKPN